MVSDAADGEAPTISFLEVEHATPGGAPRHRGRDGGGPGGAPAPGGGRGAAAVRAGRRAGRRPCDRGPPGCRGPGGRLAALHRHAGALRLRRRRSGRQRRDGRLGGLRRVRLAAGQGDRRMRRVASRRPSGWPGRFAPPTSPGCATDADAWWRSYRGDVPRRPHPDGLPGRAPRYRAGPGAGGDDRLAHLLAVVFRQEHEHRERDAVWGFAASGWRNLRTQGQRRQMA